MRRLLAVLLVVEAGLTASWLAGFLAVIGTYGWDVAVLVALRVAIAILQVTAGLMLTGGRLPAAVFARAAWIGSAVLLTVELGLGLAPSNVFPSYRWPLVVAYWIYAAAAVTLLGWAERRQATGDRPERDAG